MFLFFSRVAFVLLVSGLAFSFPSFSQNQAQGFQAPFAIQSYPQPFLPGWYANDLRATSSRVFRLATGGINGSVALAVQPISSFTGKVWVRLSPKGMGNPRVIFWAKTLKNGTGTRPALVHISWAATLEGTYQERMLLGHAAQFPNANQNFSRFELEVPAAFASLEEVYIQLEIAVGSGTGSAARWVLDDFSLEDLVVDEEAPKVSTVKGYGKREVLVAFSEPMDPVFARLNLAYQLDGSNPVEARLLLDSVIILRSEMDLEEGKDYALLISTNAGAWRYLIGDTVRFVDKENAEIIITGRTKHFLSIVGEHLSVDNMNKAIHLVSEEFNLSIPEYGVRGENVDSLFGHHWYVACDQDVDGVALAKAIDEKLITLNDDYAIERKSALKRIRVTVLKENVFMDFMQAKGKIGGQHKFPRVLKGDVLKDWEIFIQNK